MFYIRKGQPVQSGPGGGVPGKYHEIDTGQHGY